MVVRGTLQRSYNREVPNDSGQPPRLSAVGCSAVLGRDRVATM